MSEISENSKAADIVLPVSKAPRRSDWDISRRMSYANNRRLSRQRSMAQLSNSNTAFLNNSSMYNKQTPPTRTKQMENTYRLEPSADEHPLSSVVHKNANDVINGSVNNTSYCEESSGKLACELATKIQQRIKRCLPCPRYKVTCQVLVSPVKGQGLHTASRCLWNEQTDNHTSVTYQNNSMYVVATIHWVYFD